MTVPMAGVGLGLIIRPIDDLKLKKGEFMLIYFERLNPIIFLKLLKSKEFNVYG